MSQSDYIYLDMQTTNIQSNSTTVTPGNLSFTTTLNTPVIPNDYYVSVDKFQVDTSNLPILVVEPDLTTTPFETNKTIHKVAIMTSEANLVVDGNPLVQTNNLYNAPASAEPTSMSSSIDGSIVAIGYRNEFVGDLEAAGKVYVYNSNRTPIILESPSPTFEGQFGLSVSVSGNGKFIAIGTSDSASYIYIYNVISGTFLNIDKDEVGISGSNVAINNLGDTLLVSYYNLSEVILYKFLNNSWEYSTNFSVPVSWYSPIAINRAGNAIAIGFPDYGFCNYWKYNGADWNLIDYVGDHVSFGTRLDIKGPNDTILVSAPGEADGRGRIYEIKPNSSVTALELIYKYGPFGGGDGHLGSLHLIMSEDTSIFYYTTLIWGSYYEVWKINNNTRQMMDVMPPGVVTFSIQIANYGKSSTYGSSGVLRADNYGGVNTLRETNYFISSQTSLPTNLKDVPSITNVIWEQQDNIVPPNKTSLNGNNTIQFPYYHCNSYSKFIKVVNDAIANAYAQNYTYLFVNWISSLNEAKNQFIDIVARSFPIPPFLEWDATKSIAKLYVNQFFNGSSYLLPTTNWTHNNPTPTTSTSNYTKIPLKLKIAFNASLYSLFNNFPATHTIINNEQFYIIELNSKREFINLPSLKYFPLEKYTFLESYTTNGVMTIPYITSFEYPSSNYYLITKQELPTIEAWNPIYSLALINPQDISIQEDQLKTLSFYGSSSSSKDEKVDFIIKIDGNYRPTFIYNHESKNSITNLVGTSPIKTLEMDVYYISKTGILVPFKLPRSGSASLKLLFEKKKKMKIDIS